MKLPALSRAPCSNTDRPTLWHPNQLAPSFTSCSNYIIEFPQDATATQRTLLLTALQSINMQLFERGRAAAADAAAAMVEATLRGRGAFSYVNPAAVHCTRRYTRYEYWSKAPDASP